MMPGKLDDFFREGLQNIPDANPPPGQWEKIRRRELVVQAGPSGFAGYWVVGSLMAGLLIGSSAMWWYTSGYSVESIVTIEPEVVNSTVVDSNGSLSTEPAVASVMENAQPTATERIADVMVGRSKPEPKGSLLANSDALAITGRVISTVTDQASEAVIEKPGLSLIGEAQKEGSETVYPAFTSSPRTRVRAENGPVSRRFKAAPLVALPQLKYPPMRRPDKAKAALHGYAGSAFIPLPKTVSRRPRPAGRWEAGLNFAPGLTSSRVTSRVFTEQNNGNVPQVFNFNNQQIELFADDIFDQEVRQQIQLASMSLEGARQFASGIRLGLGISYSPYSLSGLNDPNDVLAPLLLEGEFATYNWAYEKRFSSFMTSGYTFLRRRKVRPYLGLRIGLDFYQEGERKSYLFRGLDGRSEEFLSSRYNSNTGLRELILNVTAQVGVQYQVHKRISLGVDLLPELAVGGRYWF